METPTDTFERLRPRLMGIAYRMLGSTAEAEEVVQDAWLRWHKAAHATLDSADAWLVTVTTRTAIDRLRAAKAQRDHYAGIWLPEPVLTDSPATPEQQLEHAEDLSVAFLAVLERLAPEARAAFLMREIFDAGYDELAHTLGKSEAACRQLVHRARAQLRDARPRYAVSRETHFRLLRSFADASASGDFAVLKSMLADDAELIGDGGGKVPSFGKPLLGGQRIAQLYLATSLRHGSGLRIELAMVNGQWSLLRFVDGTLESVQAFETDGVRILRIYAQRNPDKLARLGAALRHRATPPCHKPASTAVLQVQGPQTHSGEIMNEARLPWTRIAPKAYQAMAALATAIAPSTLGAALVELVQTRVSQINGCAFCVDMHARDLRKQGETWQRINSLLTWRETDFYTGRERAALDWAETLTRLAGQHGAHDAAFAALKTQFDDQEIVELTWAIAQINAWNRMAVGMRQPPSDKPLE